MRRARGPWGAVPAALLLAAAPVSGADKPPASSEGEWRLAPFSAVRGDFEIELKGFVQVDGRSFPNWPSDAVEHDSEVELRRTRIGTEVRWGRLRLEVDVDPHDDDGHLKDAKAAFKVSKAFWIQVGRSKIPTSPERLRSVARTDFVERSLLATHLAPDRDWGLLAFGEIGKRLSYQAGAFRGDGETVAARAGTTFAARVAVDLPKRLAAGASYSEGEVRAEPDRTSEEAVHNGLRGRAIAGYSFFDRHFVEGRRRRLGLDGSWALGAGSLKAEVLQAREERRGQGPLCEGLTCEDLSEEVGLGWAVTGTWLVGGEKHGKKKAKKRSSSRMGVLELALRYESLVFDDHGPTTTFESVTDRARNIRPAGIEAFTGGVSWWPVPWTRLIANVAVERFRDPLTAPDPGRRGDYVTVLGRLQVALP